MCLLLTGLSRRRGGFRQRLDAPAGVAPGSGGMAVRGRRRHANRSCACRSSGEPCCGTRRDREGVRFRRAALTGEILEFTELPEAIEYQQSQNERETSAGIPAGRHHAPTSDPLQPLPPYQTHDTPPLQIAARKGIRTSRGRGRGRSRCSRVYSSAAARAFVVDRHHRCRPSGSVYRLSRRATEDVWPPAPEASVRGWPTSTGV